MTRSNKKATTTGGRTDRTKDSVVISRETPMPRSSEVVVHGRDGLVRSSWSSDGAGSQPQKLQEVQDSLLSKIKESFPLVEWMKTEERRDGTVAIYLFAPYEDKMGILDRVGNEVADLVDEGIFIRILPLSTRIADRAA